MRRHRFHLNDINLIADYPEPNLYGSQSEMFEWSMDHPLYWLPKAEQGSDDAMLQLGLIYHRSNDQKRAMDWYQKASAAGNAVATGVLKELMQHAPIPAAR